MAMVTILGVLLVGAIVAGVMVTLSRLKPASHGPRCGNCDYNLTGAEANRCPECGKLFIEAGVVVARGSQRARRARLLLGFAAVAIVAMLMTAFAMIHLAERAATRAARAQAAAAAAAARSARVQQQLAASSRAAAASQATER